MKALVIFFALILAAFATAFSPPYYDDQELAASTIIVIGYCPDVQAPAIAHKNHPHAPWSEPRVHLVITRVLYGNVALGKVTLMAPFYPSWVGEPMDDVIIQGPPSNVDYTKPNIWFLSKERSWDDNDPSNYLTAFTYRSTQRLKFLPLYETLRGANRDTTIRPFLESTDPEIVSRAVDFVGSFIEPWPLPGDPNDNSRTHHIVTSQAERVRAVAEGPLQSCRAKAAALYGAIKGREAIPFMLRLLKNKERLTPIVAVGYLVKYRVDFNSRGIDIKSRDRFSAYTCCTVMQAIQDSRRTQYVPLLFRYLGDSGDGGSAGEDYYLPTLYAKHTLKEMTGFSFPQEATRSRQAWERVKDVPNRDKRLRMLTALLGDWDNPVVATARAIRLEPPNKQTDPGFGPNMIVEFEIRNRSPHKVTMRSRPRYVNTYFKDGGSSGTGFVDGAGPKNLITLKPGAVYRYREHVEPDAYMIAEKGKVFLDFTSGAGTGAWLTVIQATVIPLH
jgi:hypothetical protein